MNRFLQEILEQPEALEELLGFYKTREGIDLLEKADNILKNHKIEQIIFTGMGSSWFVSHAASILFNEMKMNSFAINASELLHYNQNLFERETLLVCISQSGESFEIRELLGILPARVHTIGVVNDMKSTLARKADMALPCRAGKEEMTSTKTYVATSLVSFILGWYLGRKWNEEKAAVIRQMRDNFAAILTGYKSWTDEILDFFGEIESLEVIARGPSFSTACQSALMFKEALSLPAAEILGGEFRHGPMEMVKKGFKAIIFAAEGKTYGQSLKMSEDIAKFGGKVLLITNRKNPSPDINVRQVFIDMPDEYLFSVQAIVPVQLFVDSFAKSKNFEAGSFSRGAKVTETE